MANTKFAQLPLLSNKLYDSWWKETWLVASCDREFDDGTFSLDKREVDIPVYYDLQVYTSTVGEIEKPPVAAERLRAGTIRVAIKKIRYSHWAVLKFDDLINILSDEKNITRQNLVKTWARKADDELAAWAKTQGTLVDLTAADVIDSDEIVDKDNVTKVVEICKAKAASKNMDPSEFSFYCASTFPSLIRDAKLSFNSVDANTEFTKGFKGEFDGINFYENSGIDTLIHRNAVTALVDAEYAIFKTKDAIQYVTPYKTTIEYDIQPDKVIGGGKGYQPIEYYDFFNEYPNRLYIIKMQYATGTGSSLT